MSSVTNLFVTPLYRAKLNDLAKKKVDYEELKSTCLAMAEDDEAGQEWCGSCRKSGPEAARDR